MVSERKIAYIDLTGGKVRTAPIPPDLTRAFLGGSGLGIKLLNDSLRKGTRPLDPDNVVVISAGLLGGTLASSSGTTYLASVSPADGQPGFASIGGFFAPELRWAGFDHLVITGKAPRLSVLSVKNGKIRILDASSMHGETAPHTQEILRKELEDDDIQTVCIGPAGEDEVKVAGVATRYESSWGGAGVGAVFGSKNLKAIVARGGSGIQIARPREAIDYDREITRRVSESDFGRRMRISGVLSLVDACDFDDAMTDLAVGRDGCFGCQLQCRHRFVIKDGTHAGTFGHSPELHALHAWAQVSCDLKTVLIANHLAASWGLDSAETARLVSWARQLYDEGIISAKDTDGLDLSSEGEEIVPGMVRLIARRQGVGASLSEGHAAALRRIGKGAQKVAFPLDSRVPGLENVSDPEKEVVAMSADMLGLCHIATAVYSDQASGLAEFSRMVGLNSGIEISADEMRESAMRAIALRVQMSDARSSENASVRAI